MSFLCIWSDKFSGRDTALIAVSIALVTLFTLSFSSNIIAVLSSMYKSIFPMLFVGIFTDSACDFAKGITCGR